MACHLVALLWLKALFLSSLCRGRGREQGRSTRRSRTLPGFSARELSWCSLDPGAVGSGLNQWHQVCGPGSRSWCQSYAHLYQPARLLPAPAEENSRHQSRVSLVLLELQVVWRLFVHACAPSPSVPCLPQVPPRTRGLSFRGCFCCRVGGAEGLRGSVFDWNNKG